MRSLDAGCRLHEVMRKRTATRLISSSAATGPPFPPLLPKCAQTEGPPCLPSLPQCTNRNSRLSLALPSCPSSAVCTNRGPSLSLPSSTPYLTSPPCAQTEDPPFPSPLFPSAQTKGSALPLPLKPPPQRSVHKQRVFPIFSAPPYTHPPTSPQPSAASPPPPAPHLSAVCTNRGPRKEPPMPMATTFFSGLPVTPSHSPLRTLSVKALILSSTSHTSGTTFLPSTLMF